MTSRTLTFHQGGVDYEYDEVQPDFAGKVVRRFTYGQEPQVIAELDLADGATVEVHGYAGHWTKDEVSVVWTDDNIKHCSCWVPAAKVRRPAEGEWHGNFVSR